MLIIDILGLENILEEKPKIDCKKKADHKKLESGHKKSLQLQLITTEGQIVEALDIK